MKILIAENDEAEFFALKEMIGSDDHEIFRAEDGKSALDLFQKTFPDTVIANLNLPVVNGYDLVKYIKELSFDKFVAVIIIVPIADESVLRKILDSGADDFIIHPVNSLMLKARLGTMQHIFSLDNEVDKHKKELAIFNDQMHREHKFAENIIANITHNNVNDIPGIISLYESADLLSGDIVLVSHAPSGGINVLVGDVSGRGLASSIVAMPVSEIFYAMTEKGFQLQSILIEINNRLSTLLPTDMFLSANVFHIDKACKALSIWSGGLPDAYLYNKMGEVENIASTHLPLGVLSPEEFNSRCELYEISPGYRFTVVTDGFQKMLCGTLNDDCVDLDELVRKIADGSSLIEKGRECVDVAIKCSSLSDDVTLLDVYCEPEKLASISNKIYRAKDLHAKSWDVEFNFNVDILQHMDPLPHVVQCLTAIQDSEAHRAKLFIILSELFTNALDHGLLGLDSALKNNPEGFTEYYTEKNRRLKKLKEGYIKVRLENSPSPSGALLSLIVEDSGPGFDQSKTTFSLGSNMSHSGRGIPLLKTLCEDLRYSNSGNCVIAKYAW